MISSRQAILGWTVQSWWISSYHSYAPPENEEMPTLVDCSWHVQTVDYTVGMLFVHRNDEYWVVMMSHLEYPTLFTTNESCESAKTFTSTFKTNQIQLDISWSIYDICKRTLAHQKRLIKTFLMSPQP